MYLDLSILKRTLCLAVFSFCLGGYSGLAGQAKPPTPTAGTRTQAGTGSGRPQGDDAAVASALNTMKAEIRAEDKERIDRAIESERFTLTVLIAMIGFAVTAIGYFGTLTAKFSRDDLRRTLTSVEAEFYLRETSRTKRAQERSQCDDAGAACNLALIAIERGDLDEAIVIGERMAEQLDALTYFELRKYLAPIYTNLACCFARKAELEPDDKERERLRSKAVSILESSMEFFHGKAIDHGAKTQRLQIEHEMKPGGDFDGFSLEQKSRLLALL